MKKPLINCQSSIVYCQSSIVYCLLSIVLLLAITGITSCRSNKKITVPVADTVEEAAFFSSCYPIKSLYVPSCRVEISGNQSLSFNGSIYVQPDSICFFRGKWLLIEVRGVIYRDSFLVVSYWERKCYKGKNDYLQKLTGYPVNPESIMMLFTADRCEETYRNKFNFIPATVSNNKILMQGQNRDLLEMNINAGNRNLENIALYHSSQRQPLFSAAYSNYEQFPHFNLPAIIDISVNHVAPPIRIKASMQQVVLNQPQQMNLTVSSKYETVVLE